MFMDTKYLENFLLQQYPDDIMELAEEGNAEAMYHAGIMHAKGIHQTQDYTKAEQWLRLAAMQKHPEAARFLGLMYLKGEGVDVDVQRGYHFIKLAAEKYDKEAQILLDRINKSYPRSKIESLESINPLLLKKEKGPLVLPIFKSFGFWAYIAGFILLYSFLPANSPLSLRGLLGYSMIGIYLLILRTINKMF